MSGLPGTLRGKKASPGHYRTPPPPNLVSSVAIAIRRQASPNAHQCLPQVNHWSTSKAKMQKNETKMQKTTCGEHPQVNHWSTSKSQDAQNETKMQKKRHVATKPIGDGWRWMAMNGDG